MSFEFLAFSDIHFHEFPYGSQTNGTVGTITGLNDRLVHCYKILEQLAEYAVSNNIRYIAFCGDMYHSKKNITKTITNIISVFFNDNKYINRLEFIMIPGNHDYVNSAGNDHSLIPFRGTYPNVTVMDNTTVCEKWIESTDKKSVLFRGIPFTEDKEIIINRLTSTDANDDSYYKIALLHTGFQGGIIGSDYISTKDHDLGPSEIPKGKWDICLFGHWHEHQRLFNNGWMIGAPLQHVWSDANTKRGFIHVILDKDNPPIVKQIETHSSIPRFWVVEHGDDLSHIRPQDFVKYKVNEPLSEDLYERVAGLVHAQIGSLPAALELIPQASVTSEDFTLSEKAVSADSALEDWVEQSDTLLEKDLLHKLGQELLNEARNKS